MLECISDFSCWQNTIAKLAPIFTAIIALVAAVIALGAIRAQMYIARRRASIDFFLKTEYDPTAIEVYKKFKQHAPLVASSPTPWQHGEYDDVRCRPSALVGQNELIA
jgi:hypothetical protein